MINLLRTYSSGTKFVTVSDKIAFQNSLNELQLVKIRCNIAYIV